MFAYNIFRINSLMIYTELIEYNSFDDKKLPLLRYFPVFSKLKSGVIIATRQYMNYQTFSNLEFRSLLKNQLLSIDLDLRGTKGRKKPVVSRCHSSCFDILKSLHYLFLVKRGHKASRDSIPQKF